MKQRRRFENTTCYKKAGNPKTVKQDLWKSEAKEKLQLSPAGPSNRRKLRSGPNQVDLAIVRHPTNWAKGAPALTSEIMKGYMTVRRSKFLRKMSISIVLWWLRVYNEPRREKTWFSHMRKQTQISFAITAKLISVFVFATRIVQSFPFLHTQFQVSSHLLWLYSPVCVGPGRKPRRPVFSRRGSNKPMLVLYDFKKSNDPSLHWLCLYAFFQLQSTLFASYPGASFLLCSNLCTPFLGLSSACWCPSSSDAYRVFVPGGGGGVGFWPHWERYPSRSSQ